MIAYNYNRFTKVFTNATNIKKDSFGNFNLPAFSTTVKPEIPDGYLAFFDENNNTWTYKEYFEYSYSIDKDGFISNNGYELKTNSECPDERYCYWNGLEWIESLGKARELKIEDIRGCRDTCWSSFDGLMLAYQRDLEDDPENQEIINLILDCKDLRAELKNAPEKTAEIVSKMGSTSEIMAVCFKDVLTIPESLQEVCSSYLEG